MKPIYKLLFISVLLSGLSACSTLGCDEYHSYQSAEAGTPIQVPADLEQPDNESVAPKVKATDASKINKDASGNCLEKPPKL